MIRAAAVARSAERPITTGLLPPSSSVSGTRFSAAARMTWRAIDVAPVKTRWSNARLAKACPTSGPPVKTAISSGSKLPANISCSSAEVAGVVSDGLIIARLPAARTPASGAKARFTGKFQGLMMPTTPLGWRRTSARAPRKPRMRGVVARRSGRIQRARWSRACFSGPIEAATSAKAVAVRERAPKSAATASSMARRWSTSKAMHRFNRSIRSAAEGAPSRRCAAFCRFKTSFIMPHDTRLSLR